MNDFHLLYLYYIILGFFFFWSLLDYWWIGHSVDLVCLDTVYFAENWKLKTIKKIFLGYYSLMKILCICLNALFMSHEPCKRCWNKFFFFFKSQKHRCNDVFIRIQTNTKTTRQKTKNERKNKTKNWGNIECDYGYGVVLWVVLFET